MPLNSTVFDSVVRILGDLPDTDRGYGQRRGVAGTGFLCAVPSRNLPGFRYGYVVTAHHVIADQNRPEVQAPVPLSRGMKLQEPVEVLDWEQPLEKVDLAFARFGGHHEGVYGGLATNRMFLPPNISPLLGSRIYYVGILDPEDRVMARSGTIGALDQEGIAHPDGYVYPTHLADCRSYAGFSGSPVFAEFLFPVLEAIDESKLPYVSRDVGDTAPRGSIDYATWLCGMLTWHLDDRRSPRASQYGVVAMLPHYEIWRGLMEFQDERDAADEINADKINDPR
jgi:Trypsin-like peptidase domain